MGRKGVQRRIFLGKGWFWKGSGIPVPVVSLRSGTGGGRGETQAPDAPPPTLHDLQSVRLADGTGRLQLVSSHAARRVTQDRVGTVKTMTP